MTEELLDVLDFHIEVQELYCRTSTVYYKIYINYSDTFTMVVYDGYTCGIQFQNKFIVQVCLEHNGTQSFNKYEFAPPQTHITCSQQA